MKTGCWGSWAVAVALLLCPCTAEPTNDPEAISKICRLALEFHDPVCKNGGYLRAENVTAEPDNCADCICPSGWAGADCSLCSTVEMCPPLTLADGTTLTASSCTSDSIVPSSDEEISGKLLSCECGGADGDASTDFLCAQQPHTNWDIRVLPSNGSMDWHTGEAAASVNERAGVYSQDRASDPQPPVCDVTLDKTECYTRDRWNYAYTGVWEGSFSKCSWKQGKCIAPMEGDDCWLYTCLQSEVYCPSRYASKCPGWTPISCANPPDGNRKYWTHHCLPGTYPMPGKALKLACKPTRGPDNRFQCYITQEGSYVASLGMRCSTGNCLYKASPPPAPPYSPGPVPDPSPSPPPSPVPPPPPRPPRLQTEVVLLIFIGLAVLALIATALYFTYRDAKRAATWMDGYDHGSGGGNGALVRFNALDPEDEDDGYGGGTTHGIKSSVASAAAAFFARSGQFGGGSSGRVELEEPLLPSSLHTTSGGQGAEASARDAGTDRSNSTYQTLSRSGFRSADSGGGRGQSAPPSVLSWHGVYVSVPKRSGGQLHILRGVSGVAGRVERPAVAGRGGGSSSDSMTGTDGSLGASSMTAILGPSGAGKTTLLDVLTGRRHGHGVRGTLRLNGAAVDAAQLRGLCAYVMQDDVLPGTLSVVEHLAFHAALRLPPERHGPRARKQLVSSIVSELGLSKVAYSLIGDAFVRGLSGGEKRRVSIATELLTRPGVMCLDEPTTGLDSTNAAKVVDIMAGLARSGVTVVMSIHQPRPDIFRLMQRVLLLSGNGQVVYSGPVATASSHFAALGYVPAHASVNIADFMLDTVIRSPAAEVAALVEAFASSPEAEQMEQSIQPLATNPNPLPPPKYVAPYWRQLSALSTRQLRNTYRHPLLVALNFSATLVTALCLGFIFRHAGTDTAGIQNRLGVLFFMLLYLSLMCLSSLPIWREERLLFMRERASGTYGTSSYFAAVMLFDLLPLRVLPPTFFALFTYWMVGLHMSCAVCLLWFIGILVSSNITAATMCMAIGAACPSNALSNMVGSLTLLMLLLFGGFLLNKERVPPYVRWLSSLSFFNYAYEALAVNEFHNFPVFFTFTSPVGDQSIIPPLSITGDGVLSEFGFESSRFTSDILLLSFLGGVCTLLTYLFLLTSGGSSGGGVDWWGVQKAAAGWRWMSAHAPAVLQRLYGHGGGAAGSGGRRVTASSDNLLDGDATDESSLLLAESSKGGWSSRRVSAAGGVAVALEQAGLSRQTSGLVSLPPGSPPGDGRGEFLALAATAAEDGGDGVSGGVPSPSSNADVRLNMHAGLRADPAAVGSRRGSDGGGGQPARPGGGSMPEVNGVSAQQPMVLSWENLTCHIVTPRGSKRYILQSINGLAGPVGEFSPSRSSLSSPGRPLSSSGTASDVIAAAAKSSHSGRGGVDFASMQHTASVPEVEQSGSGTAAFSNLTAAGNSLPKGAAFVAPAASAAAGDTAATAGGSSCLFAILGPSGAGKTTLLDILAGRKEGEGVSGEVRVNGHRMNAHGLRKVCGYVPQEVILPGTSTVWEYLLFHATLRMPQASSKEVLEQRVRDIVAELGLTKVLQSLIGDAFVRGLSGGEKRRVSIATELLTRPGVLCLDEPTTGLDSTNAAKVVDIMASLARSGVTVVMSIHQPRPDIFRLMDRVLLLSGEGQVVYTGPTAAAAAHFAALGLSPQDDSTSVADLVLDAVIKSPPAQVSKLVAAFVACDVAASDAAWLSRMQMGDALLHLQTAKALTSLKKYESTFQTQLSALCGRLLRNATRHPLLIMLNFVATLVMALGVGAIYWKTGKDTGGIQDRCGALFFICMYLSLTSLSSLPLWRDDRLVFVRERAAGAYGTAAYFTAVVLFDVLPLRVLPPTLFTAFSYWMIGLRSGLGHGLRNLLVLILTNMTAASLNMSLGAALPSVALANMVGSLAVLLATLFGGFLLSRNQMHSLIDAAAQLSYVRYAFEALVINEFHGVPKGGPGGFRFTGFHQPGSPTDQVPFVEVSGDDILTVFGFAHDTRSYVRDVFALMGLCVVFLATTFLLLRRRA